MTTLWDTTGSAIVRALVTERRLAGAVASGLALTLVTIVSEGDVKEAQSAAVEAAETHPCRLLLVVRDRIDAPQPRLDAEILVGGWLGRGESVVMRMAGRLALHPESVVLPLLAPDAPVLTLWHQAPPDVLATDPLAVLADRRITDCARAPDPAAALQQRAVDFAPGDTDLTWTRLTRIRAQLAASLDGLTGTIVSATVTGSPTDPAVLLFSGWLSSRLNLRVPVVAPGNGTTRTFDPSAQGPRSAGPDVPSVERAPASPSGWQLPEGGPGVGAKRAPAQPRAAGPSSTATWPIELEAVLSCADGTEVGLWAGPGRNGEALLVVRRGASPPRELVLHPAGLGELLAEELRRIDDDPTYAEALGAMTHISGLTARSGSRTHLWVEPSVAAANVVST